MGSEDTPAQIGPWLLGRALPTGGQAEVWEVSNPQRPGRFVLKRYHADQEFERVRGEIAALSLLRLPGVVELEDHGVAEGQAYLVTRLVEGEVFPGAARVGRWPLIKPVLISLLEVLARVHAAGFLHGDLKPHNVVVTPDGRAVLLDFGATARPHHRRQATGAIPGTLSYAAPEPPSQSGPPYDVYAVGCMGIYALTGRDPARRPQRRAADLSRVADLSPDIHALLESMLAESLADRPASAQAVLRALGAIPADPLPFLGRHALIEALEAAARAGLAMTVAGPLGSGRTRLLAEVATRLAPRKMLRLAPTPRPLDGLVVLLGAPPADSLAQLVTALAERLKAELASGAVLLVDDADLLDPHSAALLATTPGAQVCTVARGGGHVLVPLTPAELAPLFAGPDVVLHLREDAAQALFDRTGGWPDRVVAEVNTWIRLGIAVPLGPLLTVRRDTLDRLVLGLEVGDVASLEVPSGLTPTQQQLLHRLHLAAPHGAVSDLKAFDHRPGWEVEADLAVLTERRLVRRGSEGRLVALAGAPDFAGISASPANLPHAAPIRRAILARLGRMDELVEITTELFRHHFDMGRPAAASAVVVDTLLALSSGATDAYRQQLVVLHAEAALAEGLPEARHFALSMMGAQPSRPDVAELLAITVSAYDGMLDRLNALGPLPEPALESWRQYWRTRAAAEAKVLPAHIAELARELPAKTPELALARAQLAYLQGDYATAARLREEAVVHLPGALALAAQVDAASAWLEAFEPARVVALVSVMLAEAEHRRMPLLEARLRWLVRTARYRLGEELAPDLELVDAVRQLRRPDQLAMVACTEAVFAWRLGAVDQAHALALEAAECWRERGATSAQLLAQCLAAVIRPPDDATLDDLCARANALPDQTPPVVWVQIGGLLASLRPDPVAARLIGAAEHIPERFHAQRMLVLSTTEALNHGRRRAA